MVKMQHRNDPSKFEATIERVVLRVLERNPLSLRNSLMLERMGHFEATLSDQKELMLRHFEVLTTLS